MDNMKKVKNICFLVVVLLFLFTENVFADKIVYRFKASTDKDKVLLYSLCTNEGDNCTLVCKEDDVSFSSNSEAICSEWGGIKEFYLNYFKKKKDLADLKTKLQSTTCNGGSNCYKYVKETYCKNWRNKDRICKDLKSLENKPKKDKNDKSIEQHMKKNI